MSEAASISTNDRPREPSDVEASSLPYATRPPRPPRAEQPSFLGAIALGFPGILLSVFGLPMAVALPFGIIWGHSRLDWIGYLLLTATNAIGGCFVYAGFLLLRATARQLSARPQQQEL